MATIVVGVDGSDASKDALRWALDEARLREASVIAVHAWEVPAIPPDPEPMPPVDLPWLVADLSERAGKLVESVVEEVVGGAKTVHVEAVVTEGPAASVLIDAAADAELLVVGSRGHGGFAALLLGSVSQQVATHAPCPVVIHRHPG